MRLAAVGSAAVLFVLHAGHACGQPAQALPSQQQPAAPLPGQPSGPAPILRVRLAAVSLPMQAWSEQGLEALRLEPVIVPVTVTEEGRAATGSPVGAVGGAAATGVSLATEVPQAAEDRGYAVLVRTWVAGPGAQAQAVADPWGVASRLWRAFEAARQGRPSTDNRMERLAVRYLVTSAAVHLVVGFVRDPARAREVKALVDAAAPLVPDLGSGGRQGPDSGPGSTVVRVYEVPISLGALPGAAAARWRVSQDVDSPFRLRLDNPDASTCVVVTAPLRLVPASGNGSSRGSGACIGLAWPGGESRYPGYIDAVPMCPYSRGAAGATRSGSTDVVNGVGLEDYVAGVLRGEMPPTWEPEALKAQAVVIRTYALCHLGDNAERGYDVDDTVAYQRYRGAAASAQHVEAASSTAGVVATYRGKPIKAVYFAASGGHTESDQDIWLSGDEPYLEGVEDFDQGCPAYFWPAPACYGASEFLSLLGFQVKAGTTGVLGVIQPVLNSSGGFVKLAVTVGDARKVFTREDLRWKLGLKSPRFDVYVLDPGAAPGLEVTGLSQSAAITVTGLVRDEAGATVGFSVRATVDGLIARPQPISGADRPVGLTQACTVVLDGRGSGHAVGMSQWGAQGMARLRDDAGRPRYSYADIIKHYFTGVELARAY